MRISIISTTLLVMMSALLFAGITGPAQAVSDSAAANAAKAPLPRLSFSGKSIVFGTVEASITKSITVENVGTAGANLTIVPPSAPFSITAGGDPVSLAPGAPPVTISVLFAPTAKGAANDSMTIECDSCGNKAKDNIKIKLSGNFKPVPTPTPTPSGTTANTLPLSVTAGPFNAVDQAFTSVTICATGTANCTTVNSVLVDTGAFGLRIFGSQLSGLGITPNSDGNSQVGECAFFGSGSTWGSVSTVDVVMGDEPRITIPIQVIDDQGAFAPAPSDCTQSLLISSPEVAGLNGLLGVGQAPDDTIFTEYFDCSGGNCSTLNNPPGADIIPNPVFALPVDNNGVVVSLPTVPATGQQDIEGTLYFGVGTETDNQPPTKGIKTFKQNADPNDPDYLDVKTTYKGKTAGSYFDTGSNGYFFNDSSINECPDGSGFYCPAQTLSETATVKSAKGSGSGAVGFDVANANDLFNTNNAAFDNLGGTFDGGNTFDGFDWGLPFFFGRTVYLGMIGKSSSLGAGPYTAY